jgi:carbon monoxide dehydrogenase subunit G
MDGSIELKAPIALVWGKLNYPDVLKQCIPGCVSLERGGDIGFRAVAKIKSD